MAESRRAWNVALWFNNDEGLYRLMQEAIRQTRHNRAKAVQYVIDTLGDDWKTPDGYQISKSAVRSAMVEM